MERNGTERGLWGLWMFTIYRQQSFRLPVYKMDPVSVSFYMNLKINLHVWVWSSTHECFIGTWNGYVVMEVFVQVHSPEEGHPRVWAWGCYSTSGENAWVQNLPLQKQLWFYFLNSFFFSWERRNILNWGAPLA
jgi:hypothetical protein